MKINEWIFGENWKMSDMDKVRLNNQDELQMDF